MAASRMSDKSHVTEVHRSMHGLYHKGLLCDLTLVAGDGTEVRVHKLVMVTTLAHFSYLLETGGLENLPGGALRFPDVRAAGLLPLIDFVYSGEMEVSPSNAGDILQAAAVLGCETALNLCQQFHAQQEANEASATRGETLTPPKPAAGADEGSRLELSVVNVRDGRKVVESYSLPSDSLAGEKEDRLKRIIQELVSNKASATSTVSESCSDQKVPPATSKAEEPSTSTSADEFFSLSVVKQEAVEEPDEEWSPFPIVKTKRKRGRPKKVDSKTDNKKRLVMRLKRLIPDKPQSRAKETDPTSETQATVDTSEEVEGSEPMKKKIKFDLDISCLAGASGNVEDYAKVVKAEGTRPPRRSWKYSKHKDKGAWLTKSYASLACNGNLFGKGADKIAGGGPKDKYKFVQRRVLRGLPTKYPCKLCSWKTAVHSLMPLHVRYFHQAPIGGMAKGLVAGGSTASSETAGTSKGPSAETVSSLFTPEELKKLCVSRAPSKAKVLSIRAKRTHRLAMMIDNQENAFACKLCGVKHKARRKINRHCLKKHWKPVVCRHLLEKPKRRKKEVLCTKSFFQVSELGVHRASTNHYRESSALRFVCQKPYCHQVFKNCKNWRVHQRTCQGHIPLALRMSCPQCGKVVKSTTRLREHFRHFHGRELESENFSDKDSFVCFVEKCGFSTGNRYYMTKHFNSNHKGLYLECQLCKYTTVFKNDLEVHITKKHLKGKAYECDLCGKKYTGRRGLTTHRAMAHGIGKLDMTIHKCEVCPFETRCKGSLVKHRSKHSDLKLFKCDYCNKDLKTAKTLEKHVRKMHLNIRPYVCEVCGMAFGEEAELKSHQTHKHMEEKPYSCHLCSYSGSTKTALKAHLFNIHNVFMDENVVYYECDQCPFKTLRKTRYDWHVAKHKGIRQFTCDVCGMGFFNMPTLRKHRNNVHGPRNTQCPHCQHTTSDKQHLREHIRLRHTHADVKPFVCGYCDFRSAIRGNCTKHIRQVHKGAEINIVRDEAMWAMIRAQLPPLSSL